MRARSRHRRLVTAACRIYGLTLWLYPAGFRRAFGRELAVTFRTRVEDVLDAGGIRDWLAFAAHIAVDTLSTCRMLAAPCDARGGVSLLGLSDGDVAHGAIDSATLDVPVLFASAGVALALAGWFAFLVILPRYVCAG